MVGDIFDVIGQVVSNFLVSLTSAVNGITALIYDSTAGEMTFLGTLLLVSVGIGIVFWVFRLIRGATALLAQ